MPRLIVAKPDGPCAVVAASGLNPVQFDGGDTPANLTKDAMRQALRGLRRHPRSRFNPAVLVDVEHLVQLPVYRRLLAANPMPPHGRTNRQNGPAAAATAPTRRPSLAHTLPGKPRQVGHRPLMPAVALVEALTDPDLPNELARFIGNRIDVVAQVP